MAASGHGDVREAGDVRGDDGRGGRECLDEHHPEALAAERRRDEDLRRGELARPHLVGHDPEHVDSRLVEPHAASGGAGTAADRCRSASGGRRCARWISGHARRSTGSPLRASWRPMKTILVLAAGRVGRARGRRRRSGRSRSRGRAISRPTPRPSARRRSAGRSGRAGTPTPGPRRASSRGRRRRARSRRRGTSRTRARRRRWPASSARAGGGRRSAPARGSRGPGRSPAARGRCSAASRSRARRPSGRPG